MNYIKRIWHSFHHWEDIGMWRDVTKEEKTQLLNIAIEFTGNHLLYGENMLKVIDEFPIAAEHNLTDLGMNRRAWIGHAACYLATGCPEYITRAAWSQLTDEQRELANRQADNAIASWEDKYAKKNKELDKEMGRQGIFEWNT